MAGATSVKSFTDSLSSCPCLLCLDSMSSSILNFKQNAVLYFHKSVGKRRQLKKLRMLDLSSCVLGTWHKSRVRAKMLPFCTSSRKRQKLHGLIVVDELGGQYEDTFNDVKMKCDHGEIYNEISEENLKLMRERLLETIQWPSDDNTKPDQETD